jgi:hypothetical protein
MVPRKYTLEEAKLRFPPIWTIYNRPRDIPEAIAVRCWYGEVPHPDVFLTQDIEHAREYCRQQGADFCLLRKLEDDPVIVESWI